WVMFRPGVWPPGRTTRWQHPIDPVRDLANYVPWRWRLGCTNEARSCPEFATSRRRAAIFRRNPERYGGLFYKGGSTPYNPGDQRGEELSGARSISIASISCERSTGFTR